MPAPPDLVLLRHAVALPRGSWREPDADRPLSTKGVRQSERLVAHLGLVSLGRALTSPALRCVTTIESVAEVFASPVEEFEELAEGSDPFASLEATLAATVGARGPVVACTHGDVLDGCGELLAELAAGGRRLTPVRKAGAILVEVAEGKPVRARLAPPPKLPA